MRFAFLLELSFLIHVIIIYIILVGVFMEENIENCFTDKKVEAIRKYYKKNQLILELQLILYHNYNIYIRLDYIKKLHTYRLSWFDLDQLDIQSIEKCMSSEYFLPELVDTIFEIIDKREVPSNYQHIEQSKGKVILSLFHNNKEYTYEFYKYIPNEYAYLSNIFIIIFNNLPRKLQNFLFELHAELENDVTRYEYKEEFSFDLYHDDINEIFDSLIIKRGMKYYEEERVKYLEKIDENRFFAIVQGGEEYLVVIKYDEKNKRMQVYCSCPCEFYCKHIYAVILAIRNNEIKRFYKINYKNRNLSIMDRVLNFDYQLCLGIVEDNFEIINDEGDIELVPIFDSNNKCNWQVLEDDDKMSLTRELQDIIHRNY